jgi:ABC-2 type transport system ATP-binding protein
VHHHRSRRSVGGLAVFVSVLAFGCSGSGDGGSDTQGVGGVPRPPRTGESRPGVSYAIAIPAPSDPSQSVVFEVFEPATVAGGETYPLVIEGHSLGGARRRSADGIVGALVAAGYGVLSVDQPGHGESGGTIRLLDPAVEGLALVAVLDWAEANLGWAAREPDETGLPNLIVGAVGASYGGAFQGMLAAIDPKRRLDAIVPQVAWSDLERSLLPAGVAKATGLTLLSALGHTTRTGFGFDDPLVAAHFAALAAGTRSAELGTFVHGNGLAAFCGGSSLPPVHALFIQGMRDTLFPLNEAVDGFRCLRAAGGDVRLLTHQSGHNVIGVVPDPGDLLFQPPGNSSVNRCAGVDPTTATLAFFAEHLRGEAGAAGAVLARGACLSLAADDDVLVEDVVEGTEGTSFALLPTAVVAGRAGGVAIPLDYVAGGEGDVLAGIGRLELRIERAVAALPLGAEPILFLGVGHERARAPGSWDLVDNQLVPVRGLGVHVLALVGVAERLTPGDRLAILAYGAHEQFALPASLGVPPAPLVETIVSGVVFLPLLGPCGGTGTPASCGT